MGVAAETSPKEALNIFMEELLPMLEKHVPKRKSKKKSRHQMDRRRRILWRRLTKIRGRIKTASSIHKLTKLLQDKQDLEQQLFDDYSATNILEENQAISNIKSNPKAFFSFARSRQKTCAELVHLLIQTLANQTLVQSLQPQPLANNTAQFLFSQEISGRSRIQKSSLKHCLKVLL